MASGEVQICSTSLKLPRAVGLPEFQKHELLKQKDKKQTLFSHVWLMTGNAFSGSPKFIQNATENV